MGGIGSRLYGLPRQQLLAVSVGLPWLCHLVPLTERVERDVLSPLSGLMQCEWFEGVFKGSEFHSTAYIAFMVKIASEKASVV